MFKVIWEAIMLPFQLIKHIDNQLEQLNNCLPEPINKEEAEIKLAILRAKLK
jgi:hypothetical protein